MRRARWAVALAATGGLAAAPAATAALVSSESPFATPCNGAPQVSVEYRNSEVEPHVGTNPLDPAVMVAVYQQDRLSTGGANGQGTSVSTDGGATWSPLTVAELPDFSRCNGAGPGSTGDYERATDPWVSFGPDGRAYQVSLGFNDTRDLANAVIASTSTPASGYRTWTTPAVVRRDTSNRVFNDKETVTADPLHAGTAYAVWDRLIFPNDNPRARGGGVAHLVTSAFRGPAWFGRTTDGGASWTSRAIYDPGQEDQTIGNQIRVMRSDGDLVNVFIEFNVDNKEKRQGGAVAVIRSQDQGETWTQRPVIIDRQGNPEVRDPFDDRLVRTGDIIPQIAEDPRPGSNTVYVAWQDTTAGTPFSQVLVAKSTNGGLTWSAPARVNHNTAVQAFTPQIEVDAGGDLGLSYYDFTSDSPATQPLDTDTWFRELGAGEALTEANFSAHTRIHPTFDMRVAPYARGHFVGDYLGLTSGNGVFTTVFDAAIPGPESPIPAAGETRLDPQNRTDTFATGVASED